MKRVTEYKPPAHDLCVRLGGRNEIKKRLQQIARNNGLSVNKLMVCIFEWFLSLYGRPNKKMDFIIKPVDRKEEK